MNRNHDHDHAMCKTYFEKLSEFIDNELADADCEAIENHLKNCDCCSACLSTLKKTIELCAGMKDLADTSQLGAVYFHYKQYPSRTFALVLRPTPKM